jgi:uncharacterized protein
MIQKIKNLTVTGSNGKPMLTDIFFDEEKRALPVIVYAHGFNGFKDWGKFDLIANQFAEAGFAFVKFNFSHNGTTPEKPEEFADLQAFSANNYTKELDDLGFVLDWLSSAENPYSDYLNTQKVGLIGHSMGGGIAIIKTAEDNRIQALTTWASIAECKTPWGKWPEEQIAEWKENGVAYAYNSRTRQHMPLGYQLYEDFEQHTDRLNILQTISKINVPVLICHGEQDEAVEVSNAHALDEACATSDLFLVESDHVFGRKHPWPGKQLPAAMQEVVDVTVYFFKKAFR